MPKKKQPKRPDSGITGTYVYDEKSDKIVKVSDRIPSVASKGKGASLPDCGGGPACGGDCCGACSASGE
ncbi:MAG: hypothetical protein WC728_00635 [Elusimicrobiota bacterium]